VNARFPVCRHSWTAFWQPSAERSGADFGDYGTAGNNFGNRVTFRCATEQIRRCAACYLKTIRCIKSLLYERHRRAAPPPCWLCCSHQGEPYDPAFGCHAVAAQRTERGSIGRAGGLCRGPWLSIFWLPENHFGEGALPDPLMLLGRARPLLTTTCAGHHIVLADAAQPAAGGGTGGRARSTQRRSCACWGLVAAMRPEMLRAFHVPVAEKRRIFAWTLDLMKDAWRARRFLWMVKRTMR